MPNTNCLEGWKCPNCGNEDRFEVEAITWVKLTDDGSEPIGDTEFSQDSNAKCPACEAIGEVATFTDSTATTAPIVEELPDDEPQSAETWLAQAHERWQAANTDCTLASILLLAREARERWPEAKGIRLDDSDQGNYYVIDAVLDAEGEDLDEDGDFDDDNGYAGFLDDGTFATFAPFCMTENDLPRAYIDKRSGITDAILDIDAILEGVKPS